MVLTLLPFGAMAADVIDSGTCGDNLKWALTDAGVLTISGTGEMDDYDTHFDYYTVSNLVTPWHDSVDSIRSVVIKPGVTRIGKVAFMFCSNLTDVTIPSSVKSIGFGAFSDCKSLTSVTIPSGVPCIEASTFYDCESLTSVTIPSSVKSIGFNAFYNCESLTSVTIPSGVPCIENNTFYNCESLTSVTIPSSVTSIGDCAFYNCYRLTEVAIPSSVTSIGDKAFSNCLTLTEIQVAKGNPNYCSVDGALLTADRKTLLFVPGGKSFSGILNVYKGEDGMTHVLYMGSRLYTIPDGVAVVGNNAFEGALALNKVAIPESVTEIGEGAFRSCSKLTDVYYAGTQAQWDDVLIKSGNNSLLGATLHLGDDPAPTPAPEPGGQPDVKTPFLDVKPDAYYYEPVLWAVKHDPQITAGTSATTFSPDASCTRGQIVTFLWRANGQPEPTIKTNPFTDVKSTDYFYKAVLWAVEKEITAGTSKTTFSPAATVTRAQTVTFLWRAEGKPAATTNNPFTDVPAGQYYTDAVLWAVKNEITAGTSATTFSPENPCTRAQIVTFLYRDLVK